MLKTIKLWLYRSLHRTLHNDLQTECNHIWKSCSTAMKTIDTETDIGYIAESFYICELCNKGKTEITREVKPKSEFRLKMDANMRHFRAEMKRLEKDNA